MINVFQPALGLDELVAVAGVMRSNWIGKGQRVRQFEADFAGHLGVGVDHVVATTSCTEGLFQVLELVGVERREVILPSIHFIGAANAIIANGGIPVFCDVNPQTLNAEARHIEPLINRRTKALVLLHYGGYACDIEEIVALAQKHGLAVIEDAACSPATRVEGRACGTIGDFGVWSFDAMKIISTGDGGMIYAREPGAIEGLRSNMYLGLDEGSGYTSGNERWWEFRSDYPGRRAIMNDITAAIGIEQLKRLPEFVSKRAMLVSMYSSKLGALHADPLRMAEASHYFYWIQTARRDELAAHLKARGVYTTFRYYPLHRALGVRCDLPNTDWAAEHTLLLPLHPGLSYYDVDYICELIREFQ